MTPVIMGINRIFDEKLEGSIDKHLQSQSTLWGLRNPTTPKKSDSVISNYLKTFNIKRFEDNFPTKKELERAKSAFSRKYPVGTPASEFVAVREQKIQDKQTQIVIKFRTLESDIKKYKEAQELDNPDSALLEMRRNLDEINYLNITLPQHERFDEDIAKISEELSGCEKTLDAKRAKVEEKQEVSGARSGKEELSASSNLDADAINLNEVAGVGLGGKVVASRINPERSSEFDPIPEGSADVDGATAENNTLFTVASVPIPQLNLSAGSRVKAADENTAPQARVGSAAAIIKPSQTSTEITGRTSPLRNSSLQNRAPIGTFPEEHEPERTRMRVHFADVLTGGEADVLSRGRAQGKAADQFLFWASSVRQQELKSEFAPTSNSTKSKRLASNQSQHSTVGGKAAVSEQSVIQVASGPRQDLENEKVYAALAEYYEALESGASINEIDEKIKKFVQSLNTVDWANVAPDVKEFVANVISEQQMSLLSLELQLAILDCNSTEKLDEISPKISSILTDLDRASFIL